MKASISKILVAEDLSDSSPREKRHFSMLRHGVALLARRLGCKAGLLFVADINSGELLQKPHDPVATRYLKQKQNILRQQAAALAGGTSAEVAAGYPPQEILAAASAPGGPDLLAMTTHGRSGLGRLLLGGVAEEVARHSRIPVLLMGPRAQVPALKASAEWRILLASDLGPKSRRAEDFALVLARQARAELTLLHFPTETLPYLLPVEMGLAMSSFSVGSLDLEQLRERARERLQKRKAVLSRAKVAIRTLLSTKPLSPDAAILAEARKPGYACVVLGTHSRNMFSLAFVGNTARQVVLKSPIPVITVPSKR